MNLIPWRKKSESSELARPADLFRRQMDRLFEDFFGDWSLARAGEGLDFAPRLDVSENEKEVVVKAELAGLGEKDVDVSLSQGVLTISGEKKDEREEKDKAWHVVERSYGRFSRSVAVGAVDEAGIEAGFSNGVLTVRLPKSEAAQPKKIAIKTG